MDTLVLRAFRDGTLIACAIDDGCLLRLELWEPVPPLIKAYDVRK